MPLVYLPGPEALFAWGGDWETGEVRVLERGTAARELLITPDGFREVAGERLALLEAVARLAAVPAAALEALPSSFSVWALASKLALDLTARERVAPTIARRDERVEARWAAALSASEDAERVRLLALSMSPAAHAVPVALSAEAAAWAPDALLRAFLDATVDALVRATRGAPALPRAAGWDSRWQAALSGPERSFEARGFGERTLAADLEQWSEPALGARDRLRACFRLELPESASAPFTLRFLLQSPDDPSLLVPAADVWSAPGRSLARLGREFRDPQESLLEALGRAARLYPPLAAALQRAKPDSLALDPAAAWTFLGEGAPLLGEAGFGVIVPSELTRAGQRRLRLRMRVGGKATKVAGVVKGAAGLGLDELLEVDWQAVIGDQTLTARELSDLAKHKAALVQHRGEWIAIDPRELDEIQRRIGGGPTRITMREAVQAALSGESSAGSLVASVSASGKLARLLERLQQGASTPLPAPSTLRATLRPYQERGLSWLSTLSELGLGACLADDMGLGKTIQLLAFLLRRKQQNPKDTRPCLLVAPTSVLGNWQREAERFAPSLLVVPHFGGARERADAAHFPPHGLVLTSYGVLRRDAPFLSQLDWGVVALDEAQNIKSSASSTARAARSLRAAQRFALTGTPVENRLAELWSILEFANPGLLGPLEVFRRNFAVPIERYGNQQVAERLRRVVSPFVLRRVKSDPTIISDLPAKNEANMVCTLTREQATLYKAVVDEELRRIEDSEGSARRGRVLALLTHTKQICNHPAQYLGESGPLPQRSGKLARVSEMLEEALAAGDRVLVFTQFREMGERLTAHFRATLEGGVQFLHGGTSKKARDEMVQRFQEDPHGPRIFVLSLKAGGTGLNLTAASHVFHYDRWWNPAVEDQATDRAYRIGQKRNVQVHKLLCAGTVEEKIDRLLVQKRALAASVVGQGEQWITELDDSALRELFSLSSSAEVADLEAAS